MAEINSRLGDLNTKNQAEALLHQAEAAMDEARRAGERIKQDRSKQVENDAVSAQHIESAQAEVAAARRALDQGNQQLELHVRDFEESAAKREKIIQERINIVNDRESFMHKRLEQVEHREAKLKAKLALLQAE